MSWINGKVELRWYDVAQICLNGHVVNSMTVEHPESNFAFCARCGQPTISQCQNCKAPIQGYLHIPNAAGHGYSHPAFCNECGLPFPWTKSKLEAARELSDLIENLSKKDVQSLKDSLEDLVKDTPRTTVAATKFTKIISKAGKSAADGFRTILIDVLSETAKKMIWP